MFWGSGRPFKAADHCAHYPTPWQLAAGAQLNERVMKRYLRQHLEDYKVPHQIAAVDVLPKTSSGKIIRRVHPNA